MTSTLRWTACVLIVLALAATVSCLFWFGATNAGLLVDGGPPANTTIGQNAVPSEATSGTDAAFPSAGEVSHRAGPGGHAEQEGGSLAALSEILKDVVVIAAIVLVVALMQSLFARMKRTRRSQLAVQSTH